MKWTIFNFTKAHRYEDCNDQSTKNVTSNNRK